MNTGPSSVMICRDTVLHLLTPNSIVMSGASITLENPSDMIPNIEQQYQHQTPQERKEVSDLLSLNEDFLSQRRDPLVVLIELNTPYQLRDSCP